MKIISNQQNKQSLTILQLLAILLNVTENGINFVWVIEFTTHYQRKHHISADILVFELLFHTVEILFCRKSEFSS